MTKMKEIEKRYIRYRMRMDFLAMRLRWKKPFILFRIKGSQRSGIRTSCAARWAAAEC